LAEKAYVETAASAVPRSKASGAADTISVS
jgi:hypothetical protein